MAVVVTDSNGQVHTFKDGVRWGYDHSDNLQIVGKDNEIFAAFSRLSWESVRLVES